MSCQRSSSLPARWDECARIVSEFAKKIASRSSPPKNRRSIHRISQNVTWLVESRKETKRSIPTTSPISSVLADSGTPLALVELRNEEADRWDRRRLYSHDLENYCTSDRTRRSGDLACHHTIDDGRRGLRHYRRRARRTDLDLSGVSSFVVRVDPTRSTLAHDGTRTTRRATIAIPSQSVQRSGPTRRPGCLHRDSWIRLGPSGRRSTVSWFSAVRKARPSGGHPLDRVEPSWTRLDGPPIPLDWGRMSRGRLARVSRDEK